MSAQDTYSALHLGALELLHSGITTTGDFFENVLSPPMASCSTSPPVVVVKHWASGNRSGPCPPANAPTCR